MPFVYDPNLEDEENKKDGSQVQISGAAPAVDSSANSGSKTQSPSTAPETGSGFQNLDKYLQVNQGQQFGNQVAGKVQSKVDEAQQNFGTAGQSFGQKVQSANQLANTEDVNSAIANPTGADKTQFKNWEDQSYSGPNSLADSQDDYKKFWSGTNQAQTQAQLLGTEPGRFSLLDSYFGRPTYNFGQKSLDNLLIQQGGIGDKTKAIQDQATQLKTTGTNQANALQNQVGQRAGEVDANRNMVRNAIGIDGQNNVVTDPNAVGYGALGRQYQGVNDDLNAQNAERKKEYSQVQADIESGKLNENELKLLGLSGDQNVYNVDLSKYLSPGSDLTQNQTMTSEQQAYIRALNELAGTTDTFASGDLKDRTDPYTYNKEGVANELSSTKSAAQNELNTAFDFVKTHAPIEKSDIDGISPQSDPNQVLQLLNSSKSFWQDQLAKNNPYATQRLQDLDNSSQAIQKVINKYQLNRTVSSYSDPNKVSISGRHIGVR